MDLFKQIIPDKELHENYKRIAGNKYIVNIIDQLSVGFCAERDGNNKFIKEFQSTFNSSLWEIYCYALFNNIGFDFDFSHGRPDFIMSYNSHPFNVECVITNPPVNGLPEYNISEKLNSSKSLDSIVYDQVIRLLNAISSKINKYKTEYVNEPWVANCPYIIAVHTFEQPGFMKANTEAIRMALYGWHYDVQKNIDNYTNQILKSNGSYIQTGLFSNDGCNEVSGVLFSTVATTGKFRALSKEPFCIFEQLRYNSSSKFRKYQIDCRLNCKRNSKKYYDNLNLINIWLENNKRNCSDFMAKPREELIKTTGYKETIADGLHLYLNPFASNPVPDELIDICKQNHIIIHSYTIKDKQEEYLYIEDNYLIQRNVAVFQQEKSTNIINLI